MKTYPIIFTKAGVADLHEREYGQVRRLISGQWRNLKAAQDSGEWCLLWTREPFGQAPGAGIRFPPLPDGVLGKRAIYLPRWASRITLEVTHVGIDGRHVDGSGNEEAVISYRVYKENIDKIINRMEVGRL